MRLMRAMETPFGMAATVNGQGRFSYLQGVGGGISRTVVKPLAN